jgi:glucokinase
MAGMAVLGIDVGGTKVAAAVVEGSEARYAVEHPTVLESEATVVAGIASAAREVIDQAGAAPEAIGVGVPSQIDFATGTILSSVNIPLAGVALGRELSAQLGVPVFVDNDANCAGLAEAHFAQVRHLVMFTLGTGVGGGVVVDGRIFRGATGLGAELGHQVVQYDGPPCPGNCPNRGCLEALCSGTALEREAAAVATDFPDSPIGRAAREKGKASGRDVVAAAEAGDKYALHLLDRLGMFLGVGLASAINTFEPEEIVIGGGLSRASDLFLERAVTEAQLRALPKLAERVRIGLARAGPAAGLLGAGLLAHQELGDTATTTATRGTR